MTWLHIFYSYDLIKTTLIQNPIPIINYEFRDNLPLHLVSSCLAGMFATSIPPPFIPFHPVNPSLLSYMFSGRCNAITIDGFSRLC